MKENRIDDSEDLSKDELVHLVTKQAKENVIAVMKGFQSCGYDLNMNSVGSLQWAEDNFASWHLDEDVFLIEYLNNYLSRFNVHLSQLHAGEFTKKTELNLLKDKSEEDIRSRICFLKGINQLIKQVSPLVNFNATDGISKRLHSMKYLFLSAWKLARLDELINATVEKMEDQPAVIITLNPLTTIDRGNETMASSWFYQAFQVLSDINSSQLCTALPHSDDPQFPLVIKLSGEEVQGNSTFQSNDSFDFVDSNSFFYYFLGGSFRQFLSRIVDELHGASLPLLIPYIGNGPYKGMYLVRPGPLSILEKQFLVFLGQIIGIAVRSGVPFPLGMMPHFWRILVDDPIPAKYIMEADPDTAKYLTDLEDIRTVEEFDTFMEDHQFPSFTWQSMLGEEIELVPGGRNMPLSIENKQAFVQSVQNLVKQQLECQDKMNCILTGMHTILPMSFVRGLLTWEELQYRVCGSDTIDLHFLKRSTLYQVGISETDRHIQDFWSVLFSLSAKQLKLFIKFACNQERIGSPSDVNHLPPPYPMKLAPADARDEVQDKLYIRAETCIFMVKIPRYSNCDVMRQKLLYSIQSAEDLLSG